MTRSSTRTSQLTSIEEDDNDGDGDADADDDDSHSDEGEESAPPPLPPADSVQDPANDDAADVYGEANETDEFFCEEYDYVPQLGELQPEKKPKRTRSKRAATHQTDVDPRTEELCSLPGGEVDWSLDTGIAQKIPAAFRHRLKDKHYARITSSSRAAAS